jgi:Uma2 family endonuclease
MMDGEPRGNAMSVTTRLPPILPDGPIWRFTVDEYHRMMETGVLGEDDRVELIEGFVVPKMANNPPHASTAQIVSDYLHGLNLSGCCIRSQNPVTLDDSEPEPDVTIARGKTRDYVNRHPSPRDIGLIIEVSMSSLKLDKKRKARMYARAGIGKYWVIDVDGRSIDVMTNPDATISEPGYSIVTSFGGDDKVPLVLDGAQVAEIVVADLMP